MFQIFEGEQLPLEPDLFEMFISPELEYPLVCLGVRKGDEKSPLKFDILNLNSGSSWFIDLESLKGRWFKLNKDSYLFGLNIFSS